VSVGGAMVGLELTALPYAQGRIRMAVLPAFEDLQRQREAVVVPEPYAPPGFDLGAI